MELNEVFKLAKALFPEKYVMVSLSLTHYQGTNSDKLEAMVCVQDGECWIGYGKNFVEAFGNLGEKMPKDIADDEGVKDESET